MEQALRKLNYYQQKSEILKANTTRKSDYSLCLKDD